MPETKQSKSGWLGTISGIIVAGFAVAQAFVNWGWVAFMKEHIAYLIIFLIVGFGLVVWGQRNNIRKGWGRWCCLPLWERRVILLGLLIVYSVWLGWPRIGVFWPPKGKVYTQQWISEEETERYVVNILTESGKDAFIQRVRRLMKSAAGPYVTARFMCNGDTAWRPFRHNPAVGTIFQMSRYKGTNRLSAGTDCRIEYLMENVYRWDWVKFDNGY